MNREIFLPGVIAGILGYYFWVDPISLNMVPPKIMNFGFVIFGGCIGFVYSKLKF